MKMESDIAYIAGLFDGEGSVSYKQYMRKRKHNKIPYPTWQIRLEISMTDQSVLQWICDVLEVGTVGPKKYYSEYTKTWKKQWRWRCSHRDAFYVCCLLFPYAHVKVAALQKIIDHYKDKKFSIMNGKVVSLKQYKEAMSLE